MGDDCNHDGGDEERLERLDVLGLKRLRPAPEADGVRDRAQRVVEAVVVRALDVEVGGPAPRLNALHSE